MQEVFVLGAPDPEMEEIARVLDGLGLPYVFAMHRGRRVTPEVAYAADGLSEIVAVGAKLCFVECGVKGLAYQDLLDHHRPGDPGFGKAPECYMEGSSLGQLLSKLGLAPTEEQRIIAAADHCLTAAYRGECPGVSPEDLGRWRSANRAQRQKIDASELERRIEEARLQLERAERLNVGGMDVAWVSHSNNELAEASARFGIPVIYARKIPGGTKVGILGAPAKIIQEWMDTCGLEQVYGDPERGYAGGYVLELKAA